jgi:hypothetical protein
MPKSTPNALPATLKRSPAKAQQTFLKVMEHAEAEYGPGEKARRTAYAALKHSFEKIGDHWEPKAQPGPSDPRSRQSTEDKRKGIGETYGGVDVEGHTREELLDRARRLGIPGFSRMTKSELGRAIARMQG